MTNLLQSARFAGLALVRPTEFIDRAAGRRQRAAQARPPVLDAVVADPSVVVHEIVDGGARACDCDGDVEAVRAKVLDRLSGMHHHDGGTALAEILWILTRHLRPGVVVETGVARGVSSAFVLDAMRRNEAGQLWSIDLPPMTAGWGRQTGAAVDPSVRGRWTYIRGSSRRHLQRVLGRSGPVGIFVHDGLHTAENMLFEMRTVWPHVENGGFMVADDADDNDAVLTFCAEVGIKPLLLREPQKDDVVALIQKP